MKSSNFDAIKAVRVKQREEEIALHGKSIWARPKIATSKKRYNRKRDRKVPDFLYMRTLESILDMDDNLDDRIYEAIVLPGLLDIFGHNDQNYDWIRGMLEDGHCATWDGKHTLNFTNLHPICSNAVCWHALKNPADFCNVIQDVRISSPDNHSHYIWNGEGGKTIPQNFILERCGDVDITLRYDCGNFTVDNSRGFNKVKFNITGAGRLKQIKVKSKKVWLGVEKTTDTKLHGFRFEGLNELFISVQKGLADIDSTLAKSFHTSQYVKVDGFHRVAWDARPGAKLDYIKNIPTSCKMVIFVAQNGEMYYLTRKPVFKEQNPSADGWYLYN